MIERDRDRFLLALFVCAIVCALLALSFAILARARAAERPTKPDPRLDRICWQVQTAISIYTEMKESPDPALASMADKILMVYQPLDAICHEKP